MSFNQHQKDVTYLDFTENLNYLLSASLDRTVRVWNLDDASLVRVLFFPEVITTFRLTMNGDILICGGEEGNVYVWNLVKPLKLHQFRFVAAGTLGPKQILSIRMSIDERFFLIAARNKIAYFPTAKLKDERSKSAFEGFYGKIEEKGCEEVAINSMEMRDRIGLASINGKNMVAVFTLE